MVGFLFLFLCMPVFHTSRSVAGNQGERVVENPRHSVGDVMGSPVGFGDVRVEKPACCRRELKEHPVNSSLGSCFDPVCRAGTQKVNVQKVVRTKWIGKSCVSEDE